MPDMDLHNAGRAILDQGLTDAVRRDGDTERNRSQGNAPQAEQFEDSRPRTRREQARERQSTPDMGDDENRDFDDGDAFDGEDGEDRSQSADADDDREDQDGDAGDFDEDAGQEEQPREPEYEVTIFGQKSKVPVSELVAAYQRNKALSHREQAAAERGRNLDALHRQAAQDYTTRHNNLTKIMQSVERMLVGGMSDPQFAELRQRDQNAWLAARVDLEDRILKVREFLGQLYNENERGAETAKVTANAELNTRFAIEMENLKRAVPDWTDEAGAPKAAVHVGRFLEASGFKPDEYSGIIDHRMLTIAYKAMRYDQLTAKRGQPRPEAKPVRKAHKPGNSQMQPQRTGKPGLTNPNAFRQDRATAKKTGDMRDAARAISHMLK